jgi:hypothetical protein
VRRARRWTLGRIFSFGYFQARTSGIAVKRKTIYNSFRISFFSKLNFSESDISIGSGHINFVYVKYIIGRKLPFWREITFCFLFQLSKLEKFHLIIRFCSSTLDQTIDVAFSSSVLKIKSAHKVNKLIGLINYSCFETTKLKNVTDNKYCFVGRLTFPMPGLGLQSTTTAEQSWS